MSDRLASRTGSALIWQGLQLFGVKTILLVRLLVLARLLSPDPLGLMAMALLGVELMLQLTDFGLVPALIQREKSTDHHLHAAWTMGMVRSLVVSAAVIAGAPLVAWFLDEPRVTVLLRVVALRPLLQSLASIRIAELNRNLRFDLLAALRLSEATVNATLSIALAPKLGVWAMVIGTLAGAATYTVLSYLLAPYRPRLAVERDAAQSLLRFGRWIFAAGVVAVAGRLVLQAAISRQVGTAAVGVYFMAAKLAFLSSEIATEVVGVVAFPVFSRIQTNLAKVTQIFRDMLTGLGALLAPALLLLFALAPSVVVHVLGPKWEGTDPVIRVLALVALIGLFGDAAGPLFKGLGQPSRVAVLEGVQSAIVVALVWDLARRFGVVGAALAWLPAIVVSQLVAVVFLRRTLQRPLGILGAPLGMVTGASAAGAVVAFTVDRALDGLAGLVSGATAGLMVAALLLWLAERYAGLGLAESAARTFPKIASFLGISPAES